jgi:hypothetical protein
MLRMNRMMLAVVFAAGCLGSAPKTTTSTDPTNPGTPSDPGNSSNPSNPATNPSNPSSTDPTLGLAPSDTSGGTGNTFDHDNTAPDPFEVLQRIQDTGPPEISTRMHSCQKLKYATLGNVLTALGVNLNSTAAKGAPQTAGQLYKGGAQAMGVANYGARVREAIEGTTAGDTKLFDILVQAAPEIIAAVPNSASCKTAGVAAAMFDAQGNCTPAGVSCLQGATATQAQVDLCTSALTEGSTPQIGQAIAVASILAAAHTCE